MSEPKTSINMSTALAKVADRARKDPQGRMRSLAHHIDVEALKRCFGKLRNDAAKGVDGVTKEQYGKNLEQNLQELHEKLRTMTYRHQPLRRIHVPKDKPGTTRPIGISCLVDKIVQSALTELLGAIYEQDFLDCSHGFRPGKRPHDALKALSRAIGKGKANVILEADVKAFFDSIDRPMLLEILQERIADKSIMRLIGKCLKVGVLDGQQYFMPEEGTAQGSVLSPLLGNVYLHYVLDVWFERDIKPRLRGQAALIRYCDDFVIGFERMDDAQRVMEVLGKRLGRYKLQLQPDKTRLVDFHRPPKQQNSGKGPGSFDFLGFTLYWKRNRRGPQWHVSWRTRTARLRRAVNRAEEWCRSHRNLPIPQQHQALTRKILGHFNFFGVNDNTRSLSLLLCEVRRAWFKWLNRRSQRRSYNWERFNDLLDAFPFPKPRVYVNLWK